jgi:hypothetical protein
LTRKKDFKSLFSFTIKAKNNYITGGIVMAELQQTKSSFKFIGKVTRIDKDGAFKSDIATKGKKKGETYHSLRFGVKTSENNEMTVQMYDFEPEEVFLWNSDKAKKAKEQKKSYKGDRVPFDEWMERQEELREEGYAVLQTRVGLSYGEDGKLQSKGLPGFVASEEIYENLNNGDSVVVEGDIRFSEYEGRDGKLKPQTTFTIKKIHKLKDIDFESEKFEEVTYFEQEMVFVDATLEKSEKKVYVTGRTIDYSKKFFDAQFVINYSNGEDGEDKDMKKLADAFLKKIKFGDLLKVYGDAVNRVIVEEVEEEEEEEDYASILGGKKKPQHAQGYTSRTYISEMQIQGVEAWDKKVYTEDDFVKDELLDGEDDSLHNELGGKKNTKKDNPFASDDDGLDDMDEDDLPF